MAGWSEYFEEVGSFLHSLEQQIGYASESFTEYAVERIRMCISNVTRIKQVLSHAIENSSSSSDPVIERYDALCAELIDTLSSLLSVWREYESNISLTSHEARYTAPITHSGRQGRPKFVIPKEQLVYLKSVNFTWTSIASLLGVSRMTVYRRRAECGMLSDPANRLSDNELVAVLRELKTELPYIGEVIVLGAVRARGYDVTRNQCRRCIHRIDPLTIPLRWQGNLRSRRPYSVPGPNSLWHLGKLKHAIY